MPYLTASGSGYGYPTLDYNIHSFIVMSSSVEMTIWPGFFGFTQRDNKK